MVLVTEPARLPDSFVEALSSSYFEEGERQWLINVLYLYLELNAGIIYTEHSPDTNRFTKQICTITKFEGKI